MLASISGSSKTPGHCQERQGDRLDRAQRDARDWIGDGANLGVASARKELGWRAEGAYLFHLRVLFCYQSYNMHEHPQNKYSTITKINIKHSP